MNRLWVLSLLALLLIMPSAESVGQNSTVFEPAVIEGFSDRVYGVNLASEVYGKVSNTQYQNWIIEMTENGSRYVMDYSSIGGTNALARNWIVDKLQNVTNGRAEIELLGNYQNIVARLPGYLPGDLPGFAVTAHYDTVPGCPGANDDASGVAAILEVARVMSGYEWPLDIYFLVFNGHHSLGSFQGSREVANVFMNDNTELLALYNLDTLLRQDRRLPVNQRVIISYLDSVSYHKSKYWVDLAKMMANVYGIDMINPVPSSEFWYWENSDHYQFVTRGYEGVLCAFESGFSSDYTYQTPGDVYGAPGYNYGIGREMAGNIAASMAYIMGHGYGQVNSFYKYKTINSGLVHEFRLAISTPTYINVSCRWYGGGASFNIYDPEGVLVNTIMRTDTSAWEMEQVMSTFVSDNGVYRVVVGNLASTAIGIEIEVTFESDYDGNGVVDTYEHWLGAENFEADDDGDGISNAEEFILGTDDSSADSDQDTLPDLWEVLNGLNPLDPADVSLDADGDSLTNLEEYNLGLDPQSEDSDSDGMSDSWELYHGLDPCSDDSLEDPDGDLLSNLDEYRLGTDPLTSDVRGTLDLRFLIPLGVVLFIAAGVVVSRRMDPLRE